MAGRTKVSVAGLLAAAAVLGIDIPILVGDLQLALVSTVGGLNGGAAGSTILVIRFWTCFSCFIKCFKSI